MKKVFVISKYIGPKKLFMQRVNQSFQWIEECDQATAYESIEEANRVFQLIPPDTIGNCFQLERFYFKKNGA